MTLDTVRSICRALPDVTEDIKWGHDLCFCVAGRMFAVINLEAPHPSTKLGVALSKVEGHSIAFKCTPDAFGELIERPGIIPAPYMARNMWVQEQELGETLDRRELAPLIRTSYELVVAKLPRSRRPGADREVRKRSPSASRKRR